jgi:hypothetical protein
MSGREFRSFPSAPQAAKAGVFSEESVLAAARQLLAEHAAAREAAALAENQVCGSCKGVGTLPSTLMPGEVTKCWACEGSGKPNDKIQSMPALTEEDNLRIYKLGRLFENFPQYRTSLLALVRETFPSMYASAVDGPTN